MMLSGTYVQARVVDSVRQSGCGNQEKRLRAFRSLRRVAFGG